MKKSWYILLITVVAGVTLSVRANDYYVDDAYYWTGSVRETTGTTTDNSNQSSQEGNDFDDTTDQAEDLKQTEITFIEDSVTQNDKTVVKAVIRRN